MAIALPCISFILTLSACSLIIDDFARQNRDKMERFSIESCMRGYHMYKDTWEASVGEGSYHANARMATVPIHLLER